MFIIEQNYGNDGYAFWFKLLELMGDTEGHCLDCKNRATWHFLLSIARVTDGVAQKLLDLLSELEAIDPELWTNHRLVWSDNFIKGLAAAYRNRGVPLPNRPSLYTDKSGSSGITTYRKPQMKGDERKGDERKGDERKDIAPPPPGNGDVRTIKTKKHPLPLDFKISDEVRKWAEGKFDRLDEHLEAFIDYAKSSGREYVDWESAFRKAIREDWGKIRTTIQGRPKEESPKWIKELSNPPSST